MNKNAQCFAGYWRNSLADALFAKGGLNKEDIEAFIKCGPQVWSRGQISEELTTQLFKNEPNDSKTIEIVLRPKIYRNLTEHTFTKPKDIPEFVAPIATKAFLARNGRCYPLKNETIISRDILEPLVKGSFSIGSIDNLDKYLTSNDISGIRYLEDEEGDCELTEEQYVKAWNEYLTDCDKLLVAVAPEWFEDSGTFERLDYGYIVKKETIKSAAMHILPLYDKLRDSSDDTPLFDNFASKSPTMKQPCLDSNSLFSKRLAHSGSEFPLANAQRDALSHLLNAQNGEILAVNGPPGTGKTTMLLSVVASLWAKHALEEIEPPVIVAASTNNQAVTNIIDAFGKDFSTGEGVFSGRWLPGISSFGAYYPSQGKAEKASKIYQTEAFFNEVENQKYFDEAKQHYIICAQKAFPELEAENCEVKDIVHKLHRVLKKEAEKLANIELAWENLSNIRQQIKQNLGNSPSQLKAQYEEQLQKDELTMQAWQRVGASWQQYQANESIWYAFFSWIPLVTQKRLLKANVYLKSIWPVDLVAQTWQTFSEVSLFVENEINAISQLIQNSKAVIQEIEQLCSSLKKYQDEWEAALQPLNILDSVQKLSLTQVDSIADTQIRFNIFLVTTHYWEGRWLAEMEQLLPSLDKWKKQTRKATIEQSWRLRMKLTPCIVSTFYMLPSKFIYKGAGYVENHLYNFADLLIVDEAGQVLPEVAGASFALSKKALVIGDTLQIEPIWSIPPKVDIGNLQTQNIICGGNIEEQYELLKDLGKTAASGSVMRVAQQASRYHYDKDMEPGMFLYEHRRCYDEIIGFCNELVYKGKLKPMRGNVPEKTLFPALGYLHIDGVCQRANSGSRFNKQEAIVIAKWLVENRKALEEEYKEPIHKIVGIVTPFGAQVAEIKEAIKKSELDINVDGGEDSLTIGTVHALQGAERKVVIFSTVYSKHDDGTFIDNQPSMLNVAVSRAKDSFLVFGDMDILSSSSNTPRGVLAKYLFAEKTNELLFESIVREDLTQSQDVSFQLLKDTQEHDIFLQDTIKNTQKEILIVSPWVRLATIEHINILPLMEMAVQKGVKVSIYTDPVLNRSGNNKGRKQTFGDELEKIMTQFRSKGIEAHFVNKVHSKLVIKDNDLLCAGSFNWLSAQREGNYVRHETSISYQGNSHNLANEIKLLKKSFTDRLCLIKWN